MGWVQNASAEVNEESQYPAIVAICVSLTLVSIAVVGARLHIRHKLRGLANDDYMAILSIVFVVAYSGLCIAQTRYGLGLPLSKRPEASLVTYTRVNFAGRPIYQLGISFFKIALLISYLRLLHGTAHHTYRIVVWVTIVLVFLGHLGCALSLIFACSPVEKSWNPLVDGECLPAGPSFTGYAMVTIISDIAVAAIPIPILLQLNIRVEKKLGLIGIFALGLFTTLCSILRYLQIDRIQNGDGNSTMLILWGTIEFNVGNIVSSLPFLAPYFVRKAKSYRSKQSSGQDSATENRKRRLNFVQHFKVGRLAKGKATPSTSSSTTLGTGSVENILQDKNIYELTSYETPAAGEAQRSLSSRGDIENLSHVDPHYHLDDHRSRT